MGGVSHPEPGVSLEGRRGYERQHLLGRFPLSGFNYLQFLGLWLRAFWFDLFCEVLCSALCWIFNLL